MNREETKRLSRYRQEFARLQKAVGSLGPICQGTILRRVITRKRGGNAGGTRRYGPYYQWTRKEEGRTVNLNLSPPRASAYAAAIRNEQRMERLLRQLRTVSLEILNRVTPDLPRRKRLK